MKAISRQANHLFAGHNLLQVLLVIAVLTLSSSASISHAGADSATPSKSQVSAWEDQVTNLSVPSAGCFYATYPNLAWTSDATNCVNETSTPDTVGNTNDYVAQYGVTGHIYEADGYVSSGTGFTNETDSLVGANAYSLQDNTGEFTTTYDGNSVVAYMQFLFLNNVTHSTGTLKIEYWLLSGYGSSCPAKDSNLATNWESSGTYCTAWSSTYNIPQANPSSITDYQLKGYADNGGNDEAVFCNSGTSSCYAETVAYTVFDLAAHWQYSEWGFFGFVGGSGACINAEEKNPCPNPAGSPSWTMYQYLYDSSGTLQYAICDSASSTDNGIWTVEYNNLNLGSCTDGTGIKYIYWTESY
jgi:hypothetical protein